MTTIKAYKVKWNIEAQHWPNQFQMKKSYRIQRIPCNDYYIVSRWGSYITNDRSLGTRTNDRLFVLFQSFDALFDVFSSNTHDLVRSILCNFTQISTIYFTTRHDMCEEIRVKWKWNGHLIEKCIALIEFALA